MEEYIFEPSEVNISNVSRIARAGASLEEERICEISELAYAAAKYLAELLSEGMDVYEVLSLLSDSVNFSDTELPADALPENASRLGFYAYILNSLDKAAFCELLVYYLRKLGFILSESHFLRSALPSNENIIYVKNPYADEAYDVFAENFGDPRVKYARDFKEAIKSVLDTETSYCLLPLEESGARLATVAQLIFGSDLKIDSVTPVFGFDGCADIKYALLSKNFSVPDIDPGDDRYLELRISADTETPLSEILSVAEYYQAEVYRVNTVNFDTSDGKKTYYSIVFRDEGREFTSLLVYLTVFVPEFTPIGIYKNLE